MHGIRWRHLSDAGAITDDVLCLGPACKVGPDISSTNFATVDFLARGEAKFLGGGKINDR